jgi:hypothetical protein
VLAHGSGLVENRGLVQNSVVVQTALEAPPSPPLAAGACGARNGCQDCAFAGVTEACVKAMFSSESAIFSSESESTTLLVNNLVSLCPRYAE